MSSQTHYLTIESNGLAEFSDRGSRFVAYAYPLKDVGAFKTILQHSKKEHPKASHHCFAYRLGLEGNIFRVSDDGEPSGSAGRPILGQIDSRELTDILIIVVRYFGGTLLGVPGLINAYKTAAALALQVTPVVRKTVELPYDIQFDYTRMNEVMTVIKRFSCTIIQQEMQLFCLYKVGVPKESEQDFLKQVNEISGVEVKMVKL
jgi:uncharacterized YigZ family protein